MLFVISGPSGVGKTTITHALLDTFDAVFSVSVTTRECTKVEKQGEDYRFVTEAEFVQMRDSGRLLEHAHVFDHYYGTPRQPVEEAMAAGKLVILEIDVQGAIQIRESRPDAFMIFILPPTEEALLARLRDRSREPEEVIQRRFREATSEMKLARESGAYDVYVVNDDLDKAIEAVCKAVGDEMGRRQRDASD